MTPAHGHGVAVRTHSSVAGAVHFAAPATPSYTGALGDLHIRAVVRTALRAHGFAPNAHEIRRESDAWERCGTWLRDEVFPQLLSDEPSADAYRRLRVVDPYVWEALPRVAAFGYHQAAVLERLVRPAAPPLHDVMILGAAFNTAIAFLDYLVDEHGAGDLVFAAVDDRFISALFGSEAVRNECINERRRELPDGRIRVLLAMVVACVARGRLLVADYRNEEAWTSLGRYVTAAYAAQRLVSTSPIAAQDVESWISALAAKAALPSKIMVQLSMLATHGAAEAPADLQDLATGLGQLIGGIDDLVDVLKDCRAGTPTAPLLRLVEDLARSGRSRAPDADMYRALFSMSGELVRQMDAQVMLIPSADRTCRVPAPGHPVAQFATTAVALWCGWDEDDSDPCGRRHASAADDRENSPAARATRMLLAQRREGFKEAVHHFPMPDPGGSGVTIHPTLMFQRATVLDAVIDAYDAGLAVPRTVLDAEAVAILQAKHPHMRGGWSYIPEMPLLPPDVDDLGIVLQVLHRVGGRQLAAACDEPVRLAINAADPSGAVPTWIFGPREHCPEDRPAIAYIEAIGRPGSGVQPEVVANLCFGLAIHDRMRYAAPLERACSYLESVQAVEGYWASGWYAGDYYGTYRAVRVLDLNRPESPALQRARNCLQARQAADGGWGRGESDPLNTAFAVLALTCRSMGDCRDAVGRGRASLLRTQETDGGWPAVVWGAFGTPYGFQTYGSRTITTAFALKALLAASRHD